MEETAVGLKILKGTFADIASFGFGSGSGSGYSSGDGSGSGYGEVKNNGLEEIND